MAPSLVTIDVHVPKELHGKVIGKAAATLKDIESDYPGVKLTVPKRDDPSDAIVISGPKDTVEHAKARVLDICGMAPDVTGGARARAKKLHQEIDTMYEKLRATHDRDEKDKINKKINELKKDAEMADGEAAQKIFATKNAGYGSDQMDLHGLYVKEALRFVEDRLVAVDSDLRSGKLQSLTIITGAGHHSGSQGPKVKPEIVRLLKERNYPFHEDEAGGQYIVSFNKQSHAPAAAQPSKQAAQPSQQAARPTPQRPPLQEAQEPEHSNFLASCCAFLCSIFSSSEPEKPPAQHQTASNQHSASPSAQEMHRVAQV